MKQWICFLYENYNVLSKAKEVFNADTVKLVIRIILSDVFEKLNFHEGLVIEFFMAVDDFNCAFIFLFVVIYLCYLTEWAFAEDVEYLISVANVIVFN